MYLITGMGNPEKKINIPIKLKSFFYNIKLLYIPIKRMTTISKVVIARYTKSEKYVLPEGLDLEDKTVVQDWWIKWGVLHVEYVDGRPEEKIEPDTDFVDDFKCPDDTEIADADEYS